MINKKHLKEYKGLIQNTNLQKGYQEFIQLFRQLRTSLEKHFKEYDFHGNIVENAMDYSYFHFTNKELKEKGLKYVVVFLHKEFSFEIWLSGLNRKVQKEYSEKLKGISSKYILTEDPNRTDYILKYRVVDDYSGEENLLDMYIEECEVFNKIVKEIVI